MLKDRRSSSCRCRASPYSGYNKKDDKRPPKSPVISIGNKKEYEEARCPICMEHPHNAVLLLCSSHDKGCRPYMCDTSSRHSNCLDQFRKSTTIIAGKQTKLVCPLCRGEVNGWTVVNPARQFMNSKTRNCSLDTCNFTGNYSQLREHARRVHPRVRPTDVDPDRELEWRILEEDMERQDMLNMQFEFDEDDDADEFMDGVSDVASPIWDYDYSIFFGSFGSDVENVVLPEFDSASDDTNMFMEDFDSMFDYFSAHESERLTYEPLVGRSGGNARTTRSRTPVRQTSNRQISRSPVRQRSNRQISESPIRQWSNRQISRSPIRQRSNLQELADFYELRSNLP